jgi:protein-L-isoaspartate(D-aspartate) O-methyltransferase
VVELRAPPPQLLSTHRLSSDAESAAPHVNHRCGLIASILSERRTAQLLACTRPKREKLPHNMTLASDLAQRLRPAVADERALAAIAAIPRELFVPDTERRRAYENVALPIDCEQTISQPLVVARMLELLQLAPTDRVLDVGTGSGYHAALLAILAGRVWTIERHPELSAQARRAIALLGLDNVEFFVGDGWNGLPDHAPFDAINVAAATGRSPPATLEQQLADGGRLVAPVGSMEQYLIVTRRRGQTLERIRMEPVRFVPLVHGSGPDGGS